MLVISDESAKVGLISDLLQDRFTIQTTSGTKDNFGNRDATKLIPVVVVDDRLLSLSSELRQLSKDAIVVLLTDRLTQDSARTVFEHDNVFTVVELSGHRSDLTKAIERCYQLHEIRTMLSQLNFTATAS